jgi:2-dehydropantoate 2-reductase
MKVCAVGAGAVGGLIGTRLAVNTNATVCAFARGETLDALNRHGWRLTQGGQLLTKPTLAASDARELGPQDLVVLAVKAHAMTSVAASIGPLLGPKTIVLPAMNGVPWWFSHVLSEIGPEPLQSVDPGGAIAKAVPIGHVLGCVVHLSAATTEPGVVAHRNGMGLIVGEPDGTQSDRLADISRLLVEAGFDATPSSSIRKDIWYKLWGNLTMNPVSALTGATGDRMLDDPLVRRFCSAAMLEASAIGAKIGCAIDQDPEARHAVTRELGAFKTSMLVDVERGKPIELDAIVTVVHELGKRVSIPTPNIDALLGLTRLFAQSRNLYPQPSPQA